MKKGYTGYKDTGVVETFMPGKTVPTKTGHATMSMETFHKLYPDKDLRSNPVLRRIGTAKSRSHYQRNYRGLQARLATEAIKTETNHTPKKGEIGRTTTVTRPAQEVRNEIVNAHGRKTAFWTALALTGVLGAGLAYEGGPGAVVSTVSGTASMVISPFHHGDGSTNSSEQSSSGKQSSTTYTNKLGTLSCTGPLTPVTIRRADHSNLLAAAERVLDEPFTGIQPQARATEFVHDMMKINRATPTDVTVGQTFRLPSGCDGL